MRARALRLRAKKNDRAFGCSGLYFYFVRHCVVRGRRHDPQKLVLRRIGALVCRHYRRAMRTKFSPNCVSDPSQNFSQPKHFQASKNKSQFYDFVTRQQNNKYVIHAARNRIIAERSFPAYVHTISNWQAPKFFLTAKIPFECFAHGKIAVALHAE